MGTGGVTDKYVLTGEKQGVKKMLINQLEFKDEAKCIADPSPPPPLHTHTHTHTHMKV